ncbi:hypothetical protein Tco_0298793 [Tanacetum coccineum]
MIGNLQLVLNARCLAMMLDTIRKELRGERMVDRGEKGDIQGLKKYVNKWNNAGRNLEEDRQRDLENETEDVINNRIGFAKTMDDNEVQVLYSFVYAKNDGSVRRNLWGKSCRDNEFVNGKSWSIASDMNVTLHPNEHSCGSSMLNADTMEFKDCLNVIEVEDLCSSGLHFTWTKNLHKAKVGVMTGILKKLDRVMSNEEFINQYPQANAKFKRVKDLRMKLKDVQCAIDTDPHNHQLRIHKAKLMEELYEAEADKEKLLFQQAKIKWLSEEDKNTRFFHSVLKGRKCKSKVHSITDKDGIRHEGDKIPQVFLKHFQEFLGTSHQVQDIASIETLFNNKLNVGEAEKMITFFKKSWSVIGDEICKAVKEFFNKVLTNRIKHILGKLVSYNQSAFITGRRIQDNIMLTQEIMRGYNRKGGPKRCVTTDAFTLNINGDRIRYFKGERGLSEPQLQHHFGCKTIKLSHVYFADDLLVMCHRDPTSMKVIKKALDNFSAYSSLIPNNSKSIVFFGSMKEEEQNAISFVLPFAIGKLPVRYLGVFLIAKRLGVKECGCPVDKIKNKIQNWKNKYLSYAGRLQLIVVVLESIHVYWASVFLLPATIIKEINRLLKNFLWNQSEKTDGKAKVAWSSICRPKDQGGLGLKNLQT